MSRSLSSAPYGELLSAIVAARKKAGLKQTELAARLGKPQSFVSKMERGERRLDLVELVIVARAIGADEVALMRAIAAKIPSSARL